MPFCAESDKNYLVVITIGAALDKMCITGKASYEILIYLFLVRVLFPVTFWRPSSLALLYGAPHTHLNRPFFSIIVDYQNMSLILAVKLTA